MAKVKSDEMYHKVKDDNTNKKNDAKKKKSCNSPESLSTVPEKIIYITITRNNDNNELL